MRYFAAVAMLLVLLSGFATANDGYGDHYKGGPNIVINGDNNQVVVQYFIGQPANNDRNESWTNHARNRSIDYKSCDSSRMRHRITVNRWATEIASIYQH